MNAELGRGSVTAMFAGVTGFVEVAHALVAAAEDPDGNIVTRDSVSPGGIGFFLFLLLGVGTFLLWRSMNKQLKRIDFDDGFVGPGSTVDPTVDLTDSTPPGASKKPNTGENPQR
jgi:hypothetical protein